MKISIIICHFRIVLINLKILGRSLSRAGRVQLLGEGADDYISAEHCLSWKLTQESLSLYSMIYADV